MFNAVSQGVIHALSSAQRGAPAFALHSTTRLSVSLSVAKQPSQWDLDIVCTSLYVNVYRALTAIKKLDVCRLQQLGFKPSQNFRKENWRYAVE